MSTRAVAFSIILIALATSCSSKLSLLGNPRVHWKGTVTAQGTPPTGSRLEAQVSIPASPDSPGEIWVGTVGTDGKYDIEVTWFEHGHYEIQVMQMDANGDRRPLATREINGPSKEDLEGLDFNVTWLPLGP
jgi:hypothetical protein